MFSRIAIATITTKNHTIITCTDSLNNTASLTVRNQFINTVEAEVRHLCTQTRTVTSSKFSIPFNALQQSFK